VGAGGDVIRTLLARRIVVQARRRSMGSCYGGDEQRSP
jgi:hypothetical protein